MISAKKLGNLSHQLEIMGRCADFANAEPVYQAIIADFENLKSVMISLLEKMSHTDR